MAKARPRKTKGAKPAHPLAGLKGPLVLVGAGKMGGAMLEGWLVRKLPPRKVTIFDPQPSKAIRALAKKGVRINPKPRARRDEGPGDEPAAVLVIAVKPQVAADILPTLAPLIGPKTLVLSIMAGKPIAFLEAALPPCPAVRAMPNTPAAIGRGITAAVGNPRVSRTAKRLAHELLSATGPVEWLDDEALMDAVTAVSGSGPAYVFLLAETLARAGVAAGLPPNLADVLARATVAGAGELLHRSDLDAATLRQNVTSPGGTTAAALSVLMADDGLAPLMTKAVAAATKRGRELAG